MAPLPPPQRAPKSVFLFFLGVASTHPLLETSKVPNPIQAQSLVVWLFQIPQMNPLLRSRCFSGWEFKLSLGDLLTCPCELQLFFTFSFLFSEPRASHKLGERWANFWKPYWASLKTTRVRTCVQNPWGWLSSDSNLPSQPKHDCWQLGGFSLHAPAYLVSSFSCPCRRHEDARGSLLSHCRFLTCWGYSFLSHCSLSSLFFFFKPLLCSLFGLFRWVR